MDKLNNNDILVEISYLYYEMNLTQQEIADRLYISRTNVSRLLTEAREKGIVKITVNYPYEDHVKLEQQLRETFGLSEALVVNSQSLYSKESFELVCKMAANHIRNNVNNETILSVSRGRTFKNIIKYVKPFCAYPDMQIVQLTGLFEHIQQANFEEFDLVRALSDLYQCKSYCMMVPFLVESPELCEQLTNRPIIKNVLNMSEKVNTLYSSVTSIDQWQKYISEKDFADIKRTKAVGSIEGYFFDINGHIIDMPIYKRMIFPQRSIFETPKRICITSNTFKIPALLGALRGGLVNSVITDSKVAFHLLKATNQM